MQVLSRRFHLWAALAIPLLVGASFAPALAGSNGAIPPTSAVVDPAVQAIESMSFPALVTRLSPGPEAGDLALGFADGSGEVIVGGAVTVHMAAGTLHGATLTWIPDTPWILVKQSAGSGVPTDRLMSDDGTYQAPVPSCTASSVQALPRALAWWCGDKLEILPVPTVTEPFSAKDDATYKVPGGAPSVPGEFAVSDDQSMVAVRSTNAIVVHDLVSGAVTASEPVTVADDPLLLSWSPTDMLATASTSGLTLWDLTQSGPFQDRFPLRGVPQGLAWLPDGSGVLTQLRLDPPVTPPTFALVLTRLSLNQSIVEQGRLGYLLNFSSDAEYLWREEGVAATVYETPSRPGGGPFSLYAVRLPSPRDTSVALPVLSAFHMQTLTAGWAVGAPDSGPGSSDLLVTDDAGATWTVANPPLRAGIAPMPGPDATGLVLGPQIAGATLESDYCATCQTLWVWGWNSPPELLTISANVLLRLAPDGQSWVDLHQEGITLPSESAENPWQATPDVFFLTSDGWAMTYGAALDEETVFHTEEGGHHWVRVGQITPGHGMPGSPPPAGVPTRISFENPSVGWMVGTSEGYAWLYLTENGGRTWRNLRLPIPSAYVTYQVTTNAPQMFPTKIILPVTFTKTVRVGLGFNTIGAVLLYTLKDSGSVWHSTRPVNTGALHGGIPIWDVLDPLHAWVVNGGRLEVTSDGGNHWAALPTNIADLLSGRVGEVGGVGQLDFVNPSLGWLVGGESVNLRWHSILMRTDDGGRRWVAVQPRVICRVSPLAPKPWKC